MSFFQILVCIFLCIHSRTAEIPMDFSSVSMISRLTSGYAALNRQLYRVSYQDFLSKKEKEIALKSQYKEIDMQVEPVYNYQKAFMTALQNGDENLVDQSEALEELCIKRDELKTSLVENAFQIDCARLAYHKALTNLKEADIIQGYLKECAGDLEEFQSEGYYNSDHTVQPMDDIPVYGSTRSNDIHSDIACLLDGWMDIDSSSDFWLWPVSNGIISAGTWSYPRRLNASWTGYCGRHVQRTVCPC